MSGKPRASRHAGDDEADIGRAPGLQSLLLAAVGVGILMLGVQLWLLTVSLDLYLGGRGEEAWTLALVSGVIFLGGVVTLRLLWPGPARRE